MNDRLEQLLRHLRVLLLHARVAKSEDLTIQDECCIIAPHPDDETLGCGGLIARLCRQGTPPHVVILTGGGKSHGSCCHIDEEELKAQRRDLARQALKGLGLPADHLHLLDFPDGSISPTDPHMEELRRLIGELAPKQLFIPCQGEGWPDHLIVKELIQKLPTRYKIIEYCVWMWYYNVWRLPWKNARLFTLSREEQQLKRQSVELYTETLAPCGKPWSGVLPPLLIRANLQNSELYFIHEHVEHPTDF